MGGSTYANGVKAMFIITVIILGAFAVGVPKVQIKNIIYGMNSKKKSNIFLKYNEFIPFNIIPKLI